MSERITITLSTGSASPDSSGSASARFIIAGQTGLGPIDGPVVVRSETAYVALFGPRSGGVAMFDAAEHYLATGRGELVVMRAAGPAPVRASASLSAGAITVTAKNPGAAYNAWSAAYTSGTKTLTIVKGSVTATYTGVDATALGLAASVDPDVTVVVSSLPGSNVAAVSLSAGDDDFDAVVWADVLALIPDSFGAGAVAIPGLAYNSGGAGAALSAHAKNNRRLALLSAPVGSSRATVVSAAGTAGAYTGSENAVLVWPEGEVPNGQGVKTIDPVSHAAAARTVAQLDYGVGVSPLLREVATKLPAFKPAVAIGSADWALLEAAHVSTLRRVGNGSVGVDGWHTLTAPNGNSHLFGAQFRDLANAAAADVATVLERFVGRPATSVVLAQCAAECAGALDAFTQFLAPEYDGERLVHPGYRVSASNGAGAADNRITVAVSLRFAEGVEGVDFTLSTVDAGSAI